MTTVLHLNSGSVDKKSELLGNMKNLRQENPDEEIVVVLNSDAVELAVEGGRTDSIISGVENSTLKVCGNSLENREIGRSELLDEFKVVDAAVSEISRQQHGGAAYVKI